MGDTKPFLDAWCGKNKVVPSYEVKFAENKQIQKFAGKKQRQQFLCEAEHLDINSGIHGNWTLDNAKSRLHQFLQKHKLNPKYKYFQVGPDHNRSFLCELNIYVKELDRTINARIHGSNKQMASKSCACSLVRQLYHLQVIEAYTGITKKKDTDKLHLIQKRQETESGVRNKVLSTLQQSDISSKQAAYKKVALQPLPDNGLVRSSMLAAVSTAKIGKKPKRPAWDLTCRIQDMEENFLATQERTASLKHEPEEYNQRIAALEFANSVLHHDNEIKSVQPEEALSQMNELIHQRKKEKKEYEATIKEKNKEIEKLQREVNLLKQELSIQKMASDNKENTIMTLTCVKSRFETQLESTKRSLFGCSCPGDCRTKRCACQKKLKKCDSGCDCNKTSCINFTDDKTDVCHSNEN